MTTSTRLTGDAMLERIQVVNENANVLRIHATPTMKAEACGYMKEDGKVDYVAFYTALIEAKGYDIPDDNEDEEMSDIESELRERFSDEAVDAFIEVWSVDDLEYFEEAYQGEYESGAKFAQEMVEDCFGIRDLPPFVSIDWADTWDNLRYDYCEQDGFIFSTNW